MSNTGRISIRKKNKHYTHTNYKDQEPQKYITKKRNGEKERVTQETILH